MSILEKAYLKSLGHESKESSNKQRKNSVEEAFRKEAENTRLPKKEAHDIVFSRTGISKMAQEDTFSPGTMAEKRLIHANMKDSILLDRYRNLRTKLLSTSNKHNFITLVTSVVNDDNACMVAANLAATFSLDEAKTSTLIEAEIHNPKLNQVFDMNEKSGLIDYLEAEDWLEDQVLCKTGIPRLRYVPSGLPRENSAEYFTSNKMKAFVDELVERYPDRYPIINAPSITNSADARILVELCDKVILVVPYGKCSEEEIMYASMAIGEEKLVGIVLNEF